jgi:hypothetical protein
VTDDRKIPPHDAWDALEKMSLDDEAERVGGLSDDALDRELASKGLDPKALRARGEALAAKLAATAPARPKAVGRPSTLRAKDALPRARLPVLLAAAAIAAAAIVVFAMAGPAIVAMIRHNVIGPDVWDALPKRELPPEERAVQLRDNAFKECESMRWETCEDLLDEARKLNPAGESDPRVKQWRWMMRPEQRGDGAPPRLDSK